MMILPIMIINVALIVLLVAQTKAHNNIRKTNEAVKDILADQAKGKKKP